MNLQPSVAVVILNWNGRSFLEQFLPALLRSTYPGLRVLVADNGSTDDSLNFLANHYPGIAVLPSPHNEGYAKGYNLALQELDSDYYVLLNSDVEVTPGWIEPVIRVMESDPKIAACQPKILSWQHRDQFEYAGGAGGWIDSFGYPFCRGRVFDVSEADHGQYDEAQPVFWASGAAFFVRAGVFHEMHGFDEFFFAHQEEIDLCWRMQRAGYTIFACPQSIVYHVGGGSLPQGSSGKVYLNFRNNLIMLAKNYGSFEKWWKIPFRILLDIISAFWKLAGGKTGYFTSVFLAHMAFFRWLLSPKDKKYFSHGKEGNIRGIYRGNIVWQYYVRNKKTFSEIVLSKE